MLASLQVETLVTPCRFGLGTHPLYRVSHLFFLADQRVRLTKQAIQGARTIKMSGWEVLLEKRIKEVR